MFVADLDDTLYKEVEYVNSSFIVIGELLEQNRIISASEAYDILHNAPDIRSGFASLSATINASSANLKFDDKWMLEIYRTHRPNIQLNVMVENMLRCLMLDGIRIAIITDGRGHTQRAKIEALGLNRFVSPENIIISSEVGGDKTTNIPFKTLVSRNPDEKNFLYLGDNPEKDFYWPNLMGWKTVQLDDATGLNIHSQTIDVPYEYQACHRIASINEIRTYIPYM